MLSPTLFLTGILTFIGAFQIFEPMFIMTKGGPLDHTVSIVMQIYETGFRRFEMGYASALGWVLFVMIAVLSVIIFRSSNRWVYYEGGA